MTFIKIALVVAIVSVATYAASTHEYRKAGHEISQSNVWEGPLAAPFGATDLLELSIVY